VSYSLQRGASPSLGDADLAPVPSAQQALSTAVAALIAPNGGEAVDQGKLLAQFGIGFVLLPAPVDQGLSRLLNGVSGLRPVSATSAFALWRVNELAARVRVVEPGATVVAVPSGPAGVAGARAPAAGGTIELAEPAGGWTATLNGRPLTSVTSPGGGWAQAFRLPAGGGVLDIGRGQAGRDMVLAFELLAVVAVAVLALPGARSAAADAPAAIRTAAAPARQPAGAGRAVGGSRAAESARVAARAARGTRAAGAAAGAAPAAARSEAVGAYQAAAGPPQPREAPDADRAGRGGPPDGHRSRSRAGRAGLVGRVSRGPRRERGTGPDPRPGPPAAPDEHGPREFDPRESGPQPFDPEGRGPVPSGRRPLARRPAAGGPSGPHEWPSGSPGYGSSGPHEWPSGSPGYGSSGPHEWPSGRPGYDSSGPDAAWPGDRRADGSPGPRSGWPSDEPASPAGTPRSPSGSWPPPDEIPQWPSVQQGGWPAPSQPSGQHGGWPAPQQPSGWPGGRSDMLDPLPPAGGGRHGRRAPEDDEDPDARWPVPEHDPRGDAW
jgi:hypothetical protein